MLGRYFWHRLEHSNPWQTQKYAGGGRKTWTSLNCCDHKISAYVSLTTHGCFMAITEEDVDCLSFDMRNKTLWGLHAGLVGCQMSMICCSCMSYYIPEMFAFDQNVFLQQATVWQKQPEKLQSNISKSIIHSQILLLPLALQKRRDFWPFSFSFSTCSLMILRPEFFCFVF